MDVHVHVHVMTSMKSSSGRYSVSES